MGTTLSRFLRSTIVVELIAIEEFSYEVFVNSFTDVVCANVLNLKPYNGVGFLTVDVGFCLAIIDRGTGWPGKIPQKTRSLTLIEESVIGSVLSNIMEDIKICWLKLEKLEWCIEKMEMDLKSLQLIPVTELMISINFAISGDLGNGTLILCIPVAILEMLMIKSKLEKTERQKEIAVIENVIREVELNASVVFGATQLSLNELLKLKTGDVVMLDNKITEDLCLLIEGKAKHYGKPGVVGKRWHFRCHKSVN